MPRDASVGNRTADTRLKRVVHRIFDLPSFPLVIQKLTEVADNPNSNSRDMAKVMEKDQALCVKVLKLINSAFYSRNKTISSLEHAIALLGFNSIRSLALSVSVKNLIKVDESVFPQERFWAHSLATAIGSRLLAEHQKSNLGDEAFTAGLLHDIGILLEARYFPEELTEVMRSVEKGEVMQDAEEKILGVDHCLLGAWLAEQWRLAPVLRESILLHHKMEQQALPKAEVDRLDIDLQKVIQFVACAHILVRASELTFFDQDVFRGDSKPPVSVPTHLLAILGEKSEVELCEEIRQRFEESREFLIL